MYLMRTHKITSNRIFGQTNGLGTAISNWLNHYFSSNNCCLLSAAYAWLLYVMKNTYHELFRDFDFVSSFSFFYVMFSGGGRGSSLCCARDFFPVPKMLCLLSRSSRLTVNTLARTFTFPNGTQMGIFTNINLSRRRLERVRLLFFNSALLFCYAMQYSSHVARWWFSFHCHTAQAEPK